MQAILMAGGLGRRLRPYTLVIPKPLVPILDKPVIEIIIQRLADENFNKIHICLGYLGDLIRAYTGDGSKYGIEISYSTEDRPLGTVGALSLVVNLEDHFLVLNGDTLSDVRYHHLLNDHLESHCPMTIVTYAKKMTMPLGVIETNAMGECIDYIEKPTLEYKVSTGIYALTRLALSHIPNNKYYDFPTLVKSLLSAKQPVNLYEHKGIWHDLGSVENFESAAEDYAKMYRPEGRV